ncbi:Pentatricopeptide repeat-containing protein [Thalictrum thalictroides]|uniref:Pentatricopeptide repeat-containing protein n=1 Tax=Thalictrum thalictroides TaxID=46969 RepID=A0A7J6X9E3_THATH|nr:Pentatricopeptide repeat-containing protein [Thalictrum thalictroides]
MRMRPIAPLADRFVYVGTALLDLYAKTGWVFRAEQMFEDMSHRDLIAWNSLISGYSYNGYDLNAFQVLILMLEEGMSEKTTVSWNTMISANGQSGYFDEALLLFKRMCDENAGVNAVTIATLLSADAPLDSVHSYAIKNDLDSDDSVNTSLVSMYARSGNTKLAQLLYESRSCQKNLVLLTAIISSYAEQGDMRSALEFFAQIGYENMKPDAVTIVSILHGCTSFTHIDVGTAFHGYTIKSGLASDTLVMVMNGLISMYDKLNDIDAAYSLFLSLDERPVISWNTMISIYMKAGKFNDAMGLFCQMNMFGYSPDRITITSMLAGCSELNSLQIGRSFHCFILRNNLEIEDFLGTALLDMYAKCGSIKNAERVFKAIKYPCLATWNTMISGYGICGLEHESLIHYSDMIKSGIEPDDITFLGVLSACNHSGLVDEGRNYFRIMTEDFGVVPSAQHCTCMIDLFSRAGLLDEAVKFIKKMNVEPDSVMWLALLGACYTHKEVRLGECLEKKIFLLDERNGGLYVLMSNLYASIGR